jgi:hypothetical protein
MNNLDIIQTSQWEFELINWNRSIKLKYESVKWIYPDFEDIEEFDIEKAKEFYNIT